MWVAKAFTGNCLCVNCCSSFGGMKVETTRWSLVFSFAKANPYKKKKMGKHNFISFLLHPDRHQRQEPLNLVRSQVTNSTDALSTPLFHYLRSGKYNVEGGLSTPLFHLKFFLGYQHSRGGPTFIFPTLVCLAVILTIQMPCYWSKSKLVP